MKLSKMFVTGLLALSIASGAISSYAAELVYKSDSAKTPIIYEDDSKEEQYLSLKDELIDTDALMTGEEVLKTFTLTNDSENTVLVSLRLTFGDEVQEILDNSEIDDSAWKTLMESANIKIYGEEPEEDEAEPSATPKAAATSKPAATPRALATSTPASGTSSTLTSSIDADIVIDDENLTAVAAAYATAEDIAADEPSETNSDDTDELTEEMTIDNESEITADEPTEEIAAIFSTSLSTAEPDEDETSDSATSETTVTPEDLSVLYDSELDKTDSASDTKDIALAYLEPDEEQTFILSIQLEDTDDLYISLFDATDVGLTVITPEEDEIGTIENGVVVPKADATAAPTAVAAKSSAKAASTSSKTNPKTGDRSSIGLAAVMCLGALAGIVLIYKKGKEEA